MIYLFSHFRDGIEKINRLRQEKTKSSVQIAEICVRPRVLVHSSLLDFIKLIIASL
jgi:hypothetical protein